MGNIKKFEDFLDKMRGLLDNAKKQGHIIVRVEDIENTFPELKESEDEKIRKKLISFVENWNKGGIFSKYTSNANDIKRILAWLEKQGEQKPVVIIPKFRVGDEIKTSNEESLTITMIDEKGYWSEDLFICGFDDADKWELVEQKPTDTEKGAKGNEREIPFTEQKPWSEEDNMMIEETLYF